MLGSWSLGSGTESGNRHPPRADSRTSSLLVARDFASAQASCHVRRKSTRPLISPPMRVEHLQIHRVVFPPSYGPLHA